MTHISPYYRYLAIPTGYGPTDGLRWARNGDAIETADGKTFIFTAALPPFLEGFAAQRPLIHFAYILDLLDLLGHRDAPWDGIPRRACMAIRDAFRSAGTPLRNAGTFFAAICSYVPTAYLPGSNDLELAKWLAASPSLLHVTGWENPEKPPLDCTAFHRLISEALQKTGEEVIRHWFRFGRAPLQDEGKRLAEEVVDVKPPANRGTLDDLVRQRPRLAGALPLVGTMVSALTMPPRRRTPPELPLGGYADVTNRGEPELLLPSQFALDADEFIRRFAEKELLFFRKEEPHQRTREQLVLLVDQGVRTWGVVRLALSAAVLAFRKLAERKKLPFRIRFGSDVGQTFLFAAPNGKQECLPHEQCDLKALVDILETSDLALDPAALVAEEMNDAQTQDADIVLLTHPRSLRSQQVQSAGAGFPDNKRLFALTVDEEGSARFGQLRHGEEVPISRFRVNFHSTETPPTPLPADATMWTGDIEPVLYPFSIGPFRKITAVNFDADSRHVLVATDRGFLFLYSIDGGKLELLPRGRHGNELLLVVDAVLGMRGGFAVCGRLQNKQAVVHYEFRTRTVKLHRLGPLSAGTARWYGFPEQNAVAVRQVAVCRALDLNSGATYAEPERSESISPCAQHAYLRALERELPHPALEFAVDFAKAQLPDRFLIHDKETGNLRFRWDGLKTSLCPVSDGRRLLESVEIKSAQFAGHTLAIRCEGRTTGLKHWFLLDAQDPANIKEIPGGVDNETISRLSEGGHYFAQLRKDNEVAVHAFPDDGKPVLTTRWVSTNKRHTRFHNNLSVFLGDAVMEISVGRMWHTLSWREGPLRHVFDRMEKEHPIQKGMHEARRDLSHSLTELDPSRFSAVATGKVDALLDATGQVIVYDFQRRRVVCIFFPRREELAAWMPDGTRYGPSDLIGGPATPDALERLGIALRQASLAVET